jgi:hypothetical protein
VGRPRVDGWATFIVNLAQDRLPEPSYSRPMPNTLSFFAINADHVPRARRFYEMVFGWSFEP